MYGFVFLDLAKAFDKVPHKRLMEKVANHGIGRKLYKLIKGRLGSRKQRVCIKAFVSSWQAVLSRVPQGSVLGPVLFSIYTNDLDEDIRNFILKFADDTKVFGKVMDDKDKCKLQEDLNKLVSWAQRWKMEFNVTKCKVMHKVKDIDAFVRVQRRFTKRLPGFNNSTYAERLSRLNLPMHT